MTENQKLTQEEMDKVNQIHSMTQQVLINLGEIEIVKIQLEKKKEEQKKILEEINNMESEFSIQLQEKYPNSNINFSTGEVISYSIHTT